MPKLIADKLEIKMSRFLLGLNEGDLKVSGKAWVPVQKGSMITIFTLMGFQSKTKLSLPIGITEKLVSPFIQNYLATFVETLYPVDMKLPSEKLKVEMVSQENIKKNLSLLV